MNMLAAPIIHARNEKHDFPSRLLVIPDDFSDSDIQWARSYILDSTACMELSGQEGRRAVFCNDKVVVTGISVFIGHLYSTCGKTTKYAKVDGNRDNYAFIGFVIPKGMIKKAFDVPLSFLLEEYEKYMNLRWEEESSRGYLEPLREKYSDIDFPETDDLCNIPISVIWQTKHVLDVNEGSLESILARVTFEMRRSNCIAFCSNMPNASSIIGSKFTLVTSQNADRVLQVIRKRELEEVKELEVPEEKQEEEKEKKRFKYSSKSIKKKEAKPDKKDMKSSEQGKTAIEEMLEAYNPPETVKIGEPSATARWEIKFTIERKDS
ncbi:MAG: hypothetical protein K2I96_04775 [Lachnospiraceae bacterium]|nr:hypothetical protein [Lachnospiraceae bacterium]